MLENVKYLIRPEKEEERTRLKAEQEKLGVLQMKIKEHKLPVLVLVEGWGSSGKGTLIGEVIHNIDPRFFKVATFTDRTEEEKRYPFLHRYFATIPEAGKFRFLDSGWMDEVTRGVMSDTLKPEDY